MKRAYPNLTAVGGMLVAFVVALEIESILRLSAQPGTWFSRLVDDASMHVVYACALPTAVLAAWGCGSFGRRLAVSLFAATWLYMIWQIAMQIHGRRVVGVGYFAILLSYFIWTLIGLIGLRWRYGIAFECCDDEAPLRFRWQFPLRDIFSWTLAVGITLGVGRYAFPAQNYELEMSLVAVALRPAEHIDAVLHSAIALPIPLALVFRWRWLPAAGLISLAAVGLGIPYYTWRENVAMTRVIQSVPLLTSRFYFTSWPLEVLPLLIGLRLAGCRLTGKPAAERAA